MAGESAEEKVEILREAAQLLPVRVDAVVGRPFPIS